MKSRDKKGSVDTWFRPEPTRSSLARKILCEAGQNRGMRGGYIPRPGKDMTRHIKMGLLALPFKILVSMAMILLMEKLWRRRGC